MFSNSYQSGLHIELYNSQNKDLIKNWKFSGKIAKEYDPSVKGYINILNVGGVSKMHIPGNDKVSLGIVQSYIVFQIYLFSPKSFNIEIAISDTSKTKRRLMFSSSTKDIVINPLHCRIPLTNIPIGVWVNLSIDVLSFVSECFKTQTFRSIDYLSMTANCKVRRIFSMRNSLVEWEKNNNEEFQLEYAEILPKNLALPAGVPHDNINLNIDKLRISLESELKNSKEIHSNNNAILSPYNKKNGDGSGKNIINVKKTNGNTPNYKASNAQNRSKSQNKPAKNNNAELLNKQEFIENYKMRFDSKSPDDNFVTNTNSSNIGNYKNNLSKKNLHGVNLHNLNQSKNNKNGIPNFHSSIKSNKSKNIKLTKSFKTSDNMNMDKISYIENHNGNYNEGSDNKSENKSNVLLNTLNYRNFEKWENSKDGSDSIEEIYEIDERRTLENNRNFEEGDFDKVNKKELDEENLNNNDKNKSEESEEKFYYDIPIKDFKKKTQYRESGNFFSPKTTQQIKYQGDFEEKEKEDSSKRKMIEEILKDSQNTMAMIDKDRPFTPPFTKLVPMTPMRSTDLKGSVIIEKEKEELMSSVVTSKEGNKLVDSLDPSQSYKFDQINKNNENCFDLIYDHVLGCYYDPKTNMYYELKN